MPKGQACQYVLTQIGMNVAGTFTTPASASPPGRESSPRLALDEVGRQLGLLHFIANRIVPGYADEG